MMMLDGASVDAASTYACVLCDYVYDEKLGIPEHGIPPGTVWADIPEDWCCPDCGATKHDFIVKVY